MSASRSTNEPDRSGNWHDTVLPEHMPISIAKKQLGTLIDRVHLTTDTVRLSRRGRQVAILVDAQKYDSMLERLEDFEDAEAARKALEDFAETEATPIPWEEVKLELGLS